jgi:purine nucleosidase
MKQIIIDCDPGIDDALALFLAAGSPSLQVLAVTTVAGNRPVETTAVNGRKLMNLAGHAGVPVYAGAARPLGYPEARCNLVHGEDGLGGVDTGPATPVQEGHAANRLIELLMAHPQGSIELVATGPADQPGAGREPVARHIAARAAPADHGRRLALPR